MNRRTFLAKIFKVAVMAPAAPVIAKAAAPSIWSSLKAWFKRVMTPKPDGRFGQFVFPVIRRVFPTMIVNDLVAVQPMSLPSAQVFYADFMYKGMKQEFVERYASSSINTDYYKTEVIKADEHEPTMDWLDYKE